MTKVLRVVIDDATDRRLTAIAKERFSQHGLGELEAERQIEELAESAISEAALDYFRARPIGSDPGRQTEGARLDA